MPTSTHIPDAKHSFYYSLTGIVGEIRSGVSIGVGYTLPFETIAAPWIDRDELAQALREKNIPGLAVRPITYVPRYASFKDESIQGVHLTITDYRALRPVSAQMHIFEVLQRLYPEQNLFGDEKAKPSLFDEVAGGDEMRRMVLEGRTAEEIIASWRPRQEEFLRKRGKYLIYR